MSSTSLGITIPRALRAATLCEHCGGSPNKTADAFYGGPLNWPCGALTLAGQALDLVRQLGEGQRTRADELIQTARQVEAEPGVAHEAIEVAWTRAHEASSAFLSTWRQFRRLRGAYLGGRAPWATRTSRAEARRRTA
jgi:hypothetical protein